MWYSVAKLRPDNLFPYENLVASVIIFREKNDIVEVLLERRSESDKKQIWAIPSGHVEKGETIIEAAVREMKEETNLKLKPKNLQFIEKSETKNKAIFTYATVYKKDKKEKAGSDAEYIEWINVTDLPDLAWNCKELINRALKDYFKD